MADAVIPPVRATYSLGINTNQLGIGRNADKVYIKNTYVDIDDVHVKVAPFDFSDIVDDNGMVISLPATTIGSIYQIQFYKDGRQTLSALFEMPERDCYISELKLYTAFPARESYPEGPQGKSAYQSAIDTGVFEGTEEEWALHLKATAGSYDLDADIETIEKVVTQPPETKVPRRIGDDVFSLSTFNARLVGLDRILTQTGGVVDIGGTTVKTIKQATDDALNIATAPIFDFVDAGKEAIIERPLGLPFKPLNYYLEYLEGIKSVFTQTEGVVSVNGVSVEPIKAAVDNIILGHYRTRIENQITSLVGGKTSYLTYAEMVSKKAETPANSGVDVTNDPVQANNGAYNYNGVTFTKSDYDPLIQARSYADALVNINLFRGFNAYNTLINSVSFDKTTAKQEIKDNQVTYKNRDITGGYVLSIAGKLRDKVGVWVNVKSAALNGSASPIRMLVQIRTSAGTNLSSVYLTIDNGATGWIRVPTATLSAEQMKTVDNVNIQPQVIGGAELVLSDIYIGEYTPLTSFNRDSEPRETVIARATTRKSILPHWSKYPQKEGVIVNKDGDVTLAAGVDYTFTLPVDLVRTVYYSMVLEQVQTGDCRIYLTTYDVSSVQIRTAPYFPAAVGSSELFSSFTSSSDIAKLVFVIKNFSTTNPITLRNLDICYNRIAPNYEVLSGERLDVAKISADIIQSVSTSERVPNLSTAPNFEYIAKDASGKRVPSNGLNFFELASTGVIKDSTKYYLTLEKMVVMPNSGTAKVTVYSKDTTGAILGGTSTTLKVGGATTIIHTTPVNVESLYLRFDITGDAVVEAGHMILSTESYSPTTAYLDRYVVDKTGTISSEWQFPKLTGFSKIGVLDAVYPVGHDSSDTILSIPVTTATGNGQGAKWIIDIPEGSVKPYVLTFEAKTNYTGANPTKIWVRYFKKGSTVEFFATLKSLVINKDNSWTLNTAVIDTVRSGTVVGFVEIYLFTDNTSTSPLQLKRFIMTEGYHNPYVNFIDTATASESVGLESYSRLTDALVSQPQNVFSVGRQMFRPLKTAQTLISDYELIGGRQDLPTRLKDLRYVDTKGYQIATICFDDTVYLKKGTVLYRTTVDDLVSRMPKGSLVGSEYRSVFNDAGLTVVNSTTPAGNIRETGNGNLVAVALASAHYSTDKGVTWLPATGYVNVEGEFFNGWGTDVNDNVVITSGYKTAASEGGRGTGKINYSDDDGKTYKTILDLATSTFIDNAKRGSMHIHSIKYDKWWKGVWVIMGDGAFNNPGSNVTSNIWFIENPSAPIAELRMISFDSRGQDWLNEQHTSVHPMQDCILFGSDANPTGLYRMARNKNPTTLRDRVIYIDAGLSHYGCTDYRHKESLPMSIYFGKDGSVAESSDIIYLTYDGINISVVHKEPSATNASGAKVDNYAYALDKVFIFERRLDNRFTGNNTWVVGGINYMQ